MDLFEYISNKNIDDVRRLVDAGANLDIQNDNGYTPLHLAVRCPGKIDDNLYENYLNIANLLIKSGANLEITDEEGQTPLHVLASTSSTLQLEYRKSGDISSMLRSVNSSAMWRCSACMPSSILFITCWPTTDSPGGSHHWRSNHRWAVLNTPALRGRRCITVRVRQKNSGIWMLGWGCCCRVDEPNSVGNTSQVEGDSTVHAIKNPVIAPTLLCH